MTVLRGFEGGEAIARRRGVRYRRDVAVRRSEAVYFLWVRAFDRLGASARGGAMLGCVCVALAAASGGYALWRTNLEIGVYFASGELCVASLLHGDAFARGGLDVPL